MKETRHFVGAGSLLSRLSVTDGGKHYLAEWIIGMMPPHLHYVEPYFGGGSVLLRKDHEGVSEVINDLSGDISNFWQVLQRKASFRKFQRIIEATPFSEREFDAAAKGNMAAVDRAVRFFVRSRQSRQGLCVDFATLTRNRTRRQMNEQVSSWLGAIEGLPDVHERLKRVVIFNRKAVEVIKQQDGPNTLFYVDAPYVHSSRSTTTEYGDFEMSDSQHVELIKVLAKITGRAMVSMYRHPIYDVLHLKYGWKLVEKEIANHASSKKLKERKVECLWMNYRLPTS